MARHLALFVLLAGAAGCATNVPVPIRNPPEANPSVEAVQRDPDAFVGAPVRWGGTIIEVDNKQRETWVELLARPLDWEGRPKGGDRSRGRFRAQFLGFLDPAIYRSGRSLTVYGTLGGAETDMIGERGYTYPVVDVEVGHLWPEYYYSSYPYYYDAFGWPYDYGWPYHPYRFRLGFYYGHPWYW